MSKDTSSRPPLVEFHKIRLFDPSEFHKMEKLYERLLPPWEEFRRQRWKPVKSLPTVQPCVRRRRRPQPAAIPSSDHSSHIPSLPSPTSSPNSGLLVHQPVETDIANTAVSMQPVEIKMREARVVMLNLKDTNLARDITPMYDAHIAKITQSVKIYDRKESTDSGFASDDEDDARPRIKIRLVRSVLKHVKGAFEVASASSKRQKRSTDDATSIPGPSRKRPKMRTKLPSKRPRPSIMVSIPLTDRMRLTVDNSLRRRFLDDFEHEDFVNKTPLPKDALPTVEFDVSQVKMSPLAKKRYEDPPPPKYFVPYEGVENMICITCNKLFSSKQDLANHQLSNHPSSKTIY